MGLLTYDLGESLLPLRNGPQLVPVGFGLRGAGGVPLASFFDVLLDAVYDPRDHGCALFAHRYLPVYFSPLPTSHSPLIDAGTAAGYVRSGHCEPGNGSVNPWFS
jgi:hypothetical protein